MLIQSVMTDRCGFQCTVCQDTGNIERHDLLSCDCHDACGKWYLRWLNLGLLAYATGQGVPMVLIPAGPQDRITFFSRQSAASFQRCGSRISGD